MSLSAFKRVQRDVVVAVGDVRLPGMLAIPKGAKGVVLFAHGSGSSRLSSRNNYVASVLYDAGIATLLFDLLSEKESLDRRNVFDIDLLAQRLVLATKWIAKEPATKSLKIGYFGASTGSAAALRASVASGMDIAAIVSRGGRPDLALDVLGKVSAPTLLIVGGDDFGVIELNQMAFERLSCPKRLEIIPGATHLFEEPGALESVAMASSKWFVDYLGGGQDV